MRHKNYFSTLCTIILLGAGIAQAEGRIELGMPETSGTGCPSGTLSAVLSPDQSVLSILFDSFQVSAGADHRRTLEYKVCDIRIPITLPKGFRLKALSATYRGFVSLPETKDRNPNSSVIVRSIHTIHGMPWWSGDNPRSPGINPVRVENVIKGPKEEEFYFEHRLKDQIIGPCKQDTKFQLAVVLQVNHYSLTRPNRQQHYNPLPGEALAQLDSNDITHAPIEYEIELIKCN